MLLREATNKWPQACCVGNEGRKEGGRSIIAIGESGGASERSMQRPRQVIHIHSAVIERLS